jgi:hypothetical protein
MNSSALLGDLRAKIDRFSKHVERLDGNTTVEFDGADDEATQVSVGR